MATIRRTLSPVPRPGTLLCGEAISVSSPLSKSSSCYNPQLEGFLDSPRNVFSPRFGRSLEKSKSRGFVWRRVLCHFIACFVVGIFVGFTPNVSTMNLSMNVKSNRQAFSLELIPPLGNSQLHKAVSSNTTLLLESRVAMDNATISVQLKAERVVDDMLDGSFVVQTLAGFSDLPNQKLLIIATPTIPRPFQAYYLNRLALTLKLVPYPLLWIVVEMTTQSSDTADILSRTGVMYRHLVCNKNLTEIKDRSLHQINVALSHIETHRLDGIVFFAHEENIYSIDLFEHLKQIRQFGTWMVAKLQDQKPEVNKLQDQKPEVNKLQDQKPEVNKLQDQKPEVNKLQAIISGPVCNGSQVTGWHTSDISIRFRRFHADMSGFAFNSTILWDPKRWHRPTLEPIRQLDTVKDGTQASRFIEQVMEDESLMECLPLSSSRIIVWHVHLESSYSFYPHKWLMKNNLDVSARLV